MISLIILTIVLSMVSYSTSTSTIQTASFASFGNNVNEVQDSVEMESINVRGTFAANGRTITTGQAYNFFAKGASLLSSEDQDNYLYSRLMADNIACTQISKGAFEKIALWVLPTITTKTPENESIEASYFVTREGTVFVWPPFEYNDNYYVNYTTKVTKPDGTEINVAHEKEMYEDGFTFKVGNADIKVSKGTSLPEIPKEATAEEYKALATIAYDDDMGNSPVGLESLSFDISNVEENNKKDIPYVKWISANTEETTIEESVNFSRRIREIGELHDNFLSGYVTLRGLEAANGYNRTDSQAINVLAKGLAPTNTNGIITEDYQTNEAIWPSRSEADNTSVTKISQYTIQEILKIPEATMDYYVTNKGFVFVWPPVEYGGGYYISDAGCLVNKNGEMITSDDFIEKMKGEFKFKCEDVIVTIDNGEVVCDK